MSEMAYPMGPVRSIAAKWGVGVAVVTAAYDVYGVFGDSQASTSQHDSLPFVIAMGLIITGLVFGLLVPAGLRAIDQHTSSASRWALGLGIAAFVSLVVFWSGLPLILGSGAAVVAVNGLRSDITTKRMAVARGLGFFAMAAAIVVSVLGNVLHN